MDDKAFLLKLWPIGTVSYTQFSVECVKRTQVFYAGLLNYKVHVSVLMGGINCLDFSPFVFNYWFFLFVCFLCFVKFLP